VFGPACSQSAIVLAGWYSDAPDASRPYDSKHVSTQPGSLRRHQAAVLRQLKRSSVLIREVTIR